MAEKENKQKNLPDFDSLDDRLIAEPSTSPRIVAKTNLDVKSVKDENPYARNKINDTDKRLFNEFFE
ncbi:hypothetical protein [Aquibacillus rhizosphaerae]|uniref:Uncharacterized protein n=1 Tax=Aquibacillus rhizosphaerae TaxID=3051431 RepID=A0ABT7L1Q9_9BACI|nr:hypothetical protein [Aquibacillus sp. LR5S19]MDL4839783.1 hypothetical protein [Aquibacillus sp. LR5S19]